MCLCGTSSVAHPGANGISKQEPFFEAVGLRGLTVKGGRGCICTLTPSSDWQAVSRWLRAARAR